MGNVYMEANQVRFKNSTYHNVQDGLAAALEGGGGGGTTVVANPEGSATADLNKLQVGTTIYGIPETAAKVTYDNTSSGLTADDVQEAIDELNTGLSGVTELIPSGATSSNKLATASDIPDAVAGNPEGSATAGNLTKLQIGSDIYNIPSGGTGESVSVTADGTKTFGQLMNELYALIDKTKITYVANLYRIPASGVSDMYHVTHYDATNIYCSFVNVSSGNLSVSQFTINANASTYINITGASNDNSITQNDFTSNAPASGQAFTFYY